MCPRINLAHSELRTKDWPRARALITRYHPHAPHAQPAKHTVPDEFNVESQSTLVGSPPLFIQNQIVNLFHLTVYSLGFSLLELAPLTSWLWDCGRLRCCPPYYKESLEIL